MHKKMVILHYIAHNPGKKGKEIGEALDMKNGTVRTYLNYLHEERKIAKAPNFGWRLHANVDINSIPEPPVVIKEKQPWEYLQEAMKGLTSKLSSDAHVQK
jgi:predicted transcriptional regulator